MSDYVCSETSVPNDGFWGFHACRNKGKVKRDGRWYCGIHDPVARKERAAKRGPTVWEIRHTRRVAKHEHLELLKRRVAEARTVIEAHAPNDPWLEKSDV